MKTKILLVLSTAFLLNGCTTENVKYASKEEKSMALMQQCKWNPELDTQSRIHINSILPNLRDIYHANCTWITSPETASKIYYNGMNIRGFHPSKLKYLPK
jgi:hypothetical protein